MSLDQKYAEKKKSTAFLRKIFTTVALAAFICAGVYGAFYLDTRQVNEWILTEQYEKASPALNRWKWLPLAKDAVYQKLGTIQLKLLFHDARYSDGLTCANHLQGSNFVQFYKAAFLAGLNQLDAAAKTLTDLGDIPELRSEISALRLEIEHRAATRQYTFLYDRRNLPLVSMPLNGEPRILYDSIRPILQNASGDYLRKLWLHPNTQAALTIDYRIQDAALKSFGKYAGAIVVLNVRTGEILAAASNPKGIGSNEPADAALALNSYFEPGSIIKMITLSGALEKHVDLNKIFPYTCEGSLKLSDGEVLYCWKAHGVVPDVNIATAESCNVGSALIGLSMKPADLLSNLRQFGFDSHLSDTFLPIRLGKIIPADITDRYLSYLSIGLDYVQVTPLHVAMIASAIANNGLCMIPRLLLHYRNVLGNPYAEPASAPFQRFMSEETAKVLTEAMTEVVKNPEGTGHRAAMESFPFAMKTGTAGEGKKGYDALIMGFGPVPNPKIGFAILVEHSGKAEFEGARITKLFLESIQGYI